MATKVINIPAKEHGYGSFQFLNKILTTQQEMDHFLNNVRKQSHSWNDIETFLNAMSNTKVDFGESNILLVTNTEGSGSNRVQAEISVEEGRNVEVQSNNNNVSRISVIITRDVPEVGTCDMAYYCFAYVIPKNAGKAVKSNTDNPNKIIHTVVN